MCPSKSPTTRLPLKLTAFDSSLFKYSSLTHDSCYVFNAKALIVESVSTTAIMPLDIKGE